MTANHWLQPMNRQCGTSQNTCVLFAGLRVCRMKLSRMERFGSYLLYEQLGPSERGTVQRATLATGDESARAIAVKRLPAGAIPAGVAGTRDAMDAAQVSQLRHPNIVVIHRVGRIGETAYVEMEHVVGHSVDELLHDIRTNGPPTIDVVVSLVVELTHALQFAHAQGLVHGDIRPCHLLVDTTGHLKMLGFGMAELERPSAQRCYAAPESIEGAAADARADLYSVGVIAYELVTGRPLFDEHMDAELRSCLGTCIEPPAACNPECPTELDQLIMRAMAAAPDERWATASDLVAAIELVGAPAPERVREWLGRTLPPLPTTGPPPVPGMPAPPRRMARGTDRMPPAGGEAATEPEGEGSMPEDPLLAAIDAAVDHDESIHDSETVINDDETVIHAAALPAHRDLQLPLAPPPEGPDDGEEILEISLADQVISTCEAELDEAWELEHSSEAAIEATASPTLASPFEAPVDGPEPEAKLRVLSRRVELGLAFMAGATIMYLFIAWLR